MSWKTRTVSMSSFQCSRTLSPFGSRRVKASKQMLVISECQTCSRRSINRPPSDELDDARILVRHQAWLVTQAASSPVAVRPHFANSPALTGSVWRVATRLSNILATSSRTLSKPRRPASFVGAVCGRSTSNIVNDNADPTASAEPV
jgi:hypothetical protein